MVDYERIGKRIYEERKILRHLSQERMAEDLGMFQADISNLEKAKKGSGITDLSKLDFIADYFGIPLESLIFGMEGKYMEEYAGSKMKLQLYGNCKIKKEHRETLKMLGWDTQNEGASATYICGPYTVYIIFEKQSTIDFENGEMVEKSIIHKAHLYVFYKTEVVATMMTVLTHLMQYIYQPAFEELAMFIPAESINVYDVLRTLNPYWALMEFSDNLEQAEQYRKQLLFRMDELKKEPNTPVILIQSAYVINDCRKKGMLRMMLDVLKEAFGDNAVFWANLEPTDGSELAGEYRYYPIFTQAALGQMNENAAIAEKLGFTVDPWLQEIAFFSEEFIEDLGADTILDLDEWPDPETKQINKYAYKLNETLSTILKDDAALIEKGHVMEKVRLYEREEVAEKTGALILDQMTYVLIGSRLVETRTEIENDDDSDIVYACVVKYDDGRNYYALNRNSFNEQRENDRSFFDPENVIISFDTKEGMHSSRYKDLFEAVERQM